MKRILVMAAIFASWNSMAEPMPPEAAENQTHPSQDSVSGTATSQAFQETTPKLPVSKAVLSQDIVTYTKKLGSGLGSFEKFSTSSTPCRVVAPGWNPPDIPGLRELFVEAGMNITKDDAVSCHIMVSGYVTMPNGEGKPVTPVNAEFLLANRDHITH